MANATPLGVSRPDIPLQIKRGDMYTDSIKRQIVAEYESGQYTFEALRRKYQIGGKTTVAKWVARYGKHAQEVPATAVHSKKLDHLEQELLIAQTRIAYLEAMIGLAKDAYGIDLKKKFAGKP